MEQVEFDKPVKSLKIREGEENVGGITVWTTKMLLKALISELSELFISHV